MMNRETIILPLLMVTGDADLKGESSELQNAGYRVSVVEDGNAALALLTKQSFPLIILDQSLLKQDSTDLVSALKNKRSPEKNQLILVMESREQLSSSAGCDLAVDDVMSRPLDRQEMAFRLNRARRVFLLEQTLKQAVQRMKKEKNGSSESSSFLSRNMETLGRLAAGVIHEINTPVQYVGDNLHFLDDSVKSLLEVLACCENLIEASSSGPVPEHMISEFNQVRDRADTDYLKTEIPESIRQSFQGVERISEIVLAIRNLSSQSQEDTKTVDITKTISSCALITRNEWKKSAELQTSFEPDLPEAQCSPGAFNQVLINLITNAAHAIEDAQVADSERKGLIRIAACRRDSMIEIRITDNGSGIPEAVQPRIFDPFFTTKKEGRGTGQGLPISKNIIEAHKGQLTVESQAGKGSSFVVTLPCSAPQGKQSVAPMVIPKAERQISNGQTEFKRHILFVDDQDEILSGIRRMLKPMENAWDMSFTQSGKDALRFLEKKHVDVVVSDFNMKEINGLEFLREVKSRHPETIRIMLSGEIDRNFIMKTVRVVHQFIAKPTDADTLKATILRACDLKKLLNNDDLRRAVANMDSLPSLPTVYAEITKELRAPDASMKKVGALISQDTAMTTKILQLVNSAFFSLPSHIASPDQAVTLLGFDTVKALVLHYEIFSKINIGKNFGGFLEKLSRHNMETGHLAKRIAEIEKKDKVTVDQAFMGGLLHDCGKLILASNFPKEFEHVLEQSHDNDQAYVQTEMSVFKTNHSEVGAYLTGIWGFPLPIVNAIYYHHQPSMIEEDGLGPATAVYVANILAGKSGQDLDMDFLKKQGLDSRVDEWMEQIKLPL